MKSSSTRLNRIRSLAAKKPLRRIVFFDFDNTITRFDVLDDILCRFSINKDWETLEERWKKGEIGSKECLAGQLAGVRVKKDRLENYLCTIGIDPYFKRLIELLKENSLELGILTDDVDYIVKRILAHHKISGFDVYSNKMRLKDERFLLMFPHTDKECTTCAHCKRNNMLANIDKKSSVVYYIGDGRSDICAAKFAHIVFAKGYLKEYFKRNDLECVPIDSLKDVYNYFQKELA